MKMTLMCARCAKCRTRIFPKVIEKEGKEFIAYWCDKCNSPAVIRMSREVDRWKP